MKKRLLALFTIMLIVFSAVPVLAAKNPSPSGTKYYGISINGKTTGKKGRMTVKVPGGKITASSGKIEVGKKVTFTATPNSGKKFVKWSIKGKYTLVSGSLTTKSITIIPKGDVDVNAIFKNADGTPVKPGNEKPGDNSNRSPQTGATAGALFFTMLAAGGVALTSRRKMK